LPKAKSLISVDFLNPYLNETIMNKKIFATALGIAFLGLAINANSQTKTPVVTKRQVNQQERIADGVKDGQLTAPETAKLETREANIQADKKEAKSDGVVTSKERKHLKREENRTSRAIYRQKHDAQHRR